MKILSKKSNLNLLKRLRDCLEELYWKKAFVKHVNAQTKRYKTRLHLASKYGHLNLARLLIKNGAFVNTQNKNFWSPQNNATENGHLDLAKLLLQNGAEANLCTKRPRGVSLRFTQHRKTIIWS